MSYDKIGASSKRAGGNPYKKVNQNDEENLANPLLTGNINR